MFKPKASFIRFAATGPLPGGQYWSGPYYAPPGITIVLTKDDLNGDDKPDMIITSDGDSSSVWNGWLDKDGNSLSGQERVVVPYPKNGCDLC